LTFLSLAAALVEVVVMQAAVVRVK